MPLRGIEYLENSIGSAGALGIWRLRTRQARVHSLEFLYFVISWNELKFLSYFFELIHHGHKLLEIYQLFLESFGIYLDYALYWYNLFTDSTASNFTVLINRNLHLSEVFLTNRLHFCPSLINHLHNISRQRTFFKIFQILLNMLHRASTNNSSIAMLLLQLWMVIYPP